MQTVSLSLFRFGSVPARAWAFAQMGLARPALGNTQNESNTHALKHTTPTHTNWDTHTHMHAHKTNTHTDKQTNEHYFRLTVFSQHQSTVIT